MEEVLEQLIVECSAYTKKGTLANYIPELTKADPDMLGAYIIFSDGKHYLSEKACGSKNRALAYLLKSYGMLDDDVEEVLDCYFKACSISVTCKDLANIGFVLANRGRVPDRNERIVPVKYTRYVNAILMTCGMYDGSGEFALRVGVPAKSGVGGGIMAVVPTKMGIGIYSPALDEKGNSVAGIQLLEQISNQLYLSIF